MTYLFSRPGKASVIIDGQFGSTGKGLIAAYLAERNKFDVATTNASANAGHTTVMGDRKFITYHLPTTAIIQTNCVAYLNAGAIIDPEVLKREVEEFNIADRLVIHPHAAVIYQHHRDAERNAEADTTKTGSTQKGCGAALADKIMRRGNVAKNDPYLRQFVNPHFHLGEMLREGAKVVVEVPQGFSLGVNSGFYPHTTSREVSVCQALSDAGLHPSDLGPVMMTARTYPIRVGNIFDSEGREIGNSGSGYPDQLELDWEKAFPHLEPEVTTVTKRRRRIFEWSHQQWVHATEVIRPNYVFLNFVNYMPFMADLLKLEEEAGALYQCRSGLPFTHFGFGPDVADVVEQHLLKAFIQKRGLWPMAGV